MPSQFDQLVRWVSLTALAATLVPSMLSFAGIVGQATVQWATFVATVVWFATAPLWLGREPRIDAHEVEI